jgi:hypothetical protein
MLGGGAGYEYAALSKRLTGCLGSLTESPKLARVKGNKRTLHDGQQGHGRLLPKVPHQLILGKTADLQGGEA